MVDLSKIKEMYEENKRLREALSNLREAQKDYIAHRTGDKELREAKGKIVAKRAEEADKALADTDACHYIAGECKDR